ncbi:hypothetical protein HID58_005737 [Brassica napus]|uniref:Uncharacterized protein n=1 Tax=Brassica napus TaxID=3708 RepID=A0ABQ8E9G4_BRANA|nr:hypothetical protein HID58_005737 [Brassica napus]
METLMCGSTSLTFLITFLLQLSLRVRFSAYMEDFHLL